MKKFICAILILICIVPVAIAEQPDLSGYTYDQLVDLQRSITMEIMNRPEWKEVTVPGGTWVVGVDIPAGVYSIKPEGKYGAFIKIYDENGSSKFLQGVRNESNSLGKVEIKEGYTIIIEDGSLIFAPAIGLGF